MIDILENEVVNVFLIIGGSLFVFGAVKLGLAVYKAEKKIKSLDEKENEGSGELDDN